MTPATIEVIGPVLAMLGAALAVFPLGSIIFALSDDGRDGRHASPRPAYARRLPGAHRLAGVAPGSIYAPTITSTLATANRNRRRPGLTRTERRGIEIT